MPTIPTLSQLVPVDVKSVWPLEASSFTPWLLTNADVLGQVLGMDLELHAAEHKVGDFSLDLIGRDVQTDETVIVENQFGSTDHRHLGQLLTYAGGTDPRTIVWIAPKFRDEHRSALDWLNQHTDEQIRFFGVQLAAVTLAGAPTDLVAPLLELVVKPNDWGKAVKRGAAAGVDGDAAADSGQSELRKLYGRFWEQFAEVARKHRWTNSTPRDRHWWAMPSGTSGVRFTVAFHRGSLGSELFFHDPDPTVNDARYAALAQHRKALEDAFGGPLRWQALPHRKGARVSVHLEGARVTETDSWPEYFAFLEDSTLKLRAALQAVGGVPSVAEGKAVLAAQQAEDATLSAAAEDDESDDDADSAASGAHTDTATSPNGGLGSAPLD